MRTLFYSVLVNSDLDPWSIRTPTTGQFGPFCNGQFGPHQIFFFGQFGPFSLVNSDLISGQYGPLLGLDFGQFGPKINSDLGQFEPYFKEPYTGNNGYNLKAKHRVHHGCPPRRGKT